MYIILLFMVFSQGVFAEEAIVEDFEEYTVNEFPSGWGIKKGMWYTSGKDNKTCRVMVEENNKFLRIDSKSDSYTVGKEYKYNISKFKFLSWRWRVNKFPTGSDESMKDLGDSAAGIYVVFPGFVIPYSIKYVWSEKKDVGSVMDSPYTSRAKIVVLRKGKDKLGDWVTEKVNVYEDYKRVFKTDNVDKNPKVIAFLTDSDNTSSSASADYDDIKVLEE